MDKQPGSRRERYRAETQQEAKEIALRQLAEGGIEAVSLMAIGKKMGISGPALYRYFANRDALLTELIVNAYSDLGDAITEVAQKGETTSAQERLRALAGRWREWALAQPHRYLLIYGTPIPGYNAPADTVLLARRILMPFIQALSESPTSKAAPNPRLTALDAQLSERVSDGRQETTTGPLLRQGLIWWARLHGVISLEVEGHFATMGFDPALLFEGEVEALLEGN